METALTELPLALFTTLGSIAAGAFVALAVAFCTKRYTGTELKAIDRFTLVPLLVALVGLACSFTHLANPFNALNVVNTLFASPMTNEIMAFGVFMSAAALYWLVALFGKISYTVRRAWVLVVAVLAVVACTMMGIAYMIVTIPTWDTPFAPASMIGFGLFGGMLLGLLVLSLAKASLSEPGKNVSVALFVFGFLLALVSVIVLFVIGSTATSAVVDVAANSASLMAPFVAFIILAVVGCGIGFFSIKIRLFNGVVITGVIIIVVAVFLARLTFYGMQIGIGL